MTRVQLPLIVGLLFFLGSCGGTFEQPQLAPSVELPEQFVESLPNTSKGIEFWQGLGGDELLTLQEEALGNNLELSMAMTRLEAAGEEARIVGADRLPSVSASLNSGRQKQNFIGFPIPGSSGGVLSSTTSSSGVSLSVQWEVDLWGRLRAGRAAAGRRILASEADLQSARLSLEAQVAKAFLAVQAAEIRLALTRRSLENRRSTASKLSDRFSRGLSTVTDLRLARADRDFTRAREIGDQLLLQRTSRSLEILLGRYPRGDYSVLGENPRLGPSTQTPLPELPRLQPKDLLQRRPDLRAAEHRATALGLQVDEARAALFPRLSLSASGGTRTEEMSDLADLDFSVWNLAGNLLQPVFQGGRLRAALRLSQWRYLEAISSYQLALLRAFGEVENALATEKGAALEAEALANASLESRKAAERSQDDYANGLADILVLLLSEGRAIDAESRWVDAEFRRRNAHIDAYLALGGGPDSTTSESPTADSSP